MINKKGFSLPDVLIAITVFLLASTAIFGLISYTTRLSTYVLHSFEATNLAREGIEIMENVRGANLISHLPWTLPETDIKWKTTDIFSETLKNDKKVCILVGLSASGDTTPWTISPAPKPCTVYEDTSKLKDFNQKSEILNGINLEKTSIGDNKELLLPTATVSSDRSKTHYGRIVMLEIKPRSTYNLTSTPTSQNILNDDDILQVTSKVFWIEGGELKTSELKKIFTRWSTSI